MGSCLSLLTLMVLISYGSWKLVVLVTSQDFKIRVGEQKDFFDESDNFTFSANNFMIAAAVTAYDGKREDITDAEIG